MSQPKPSPEASSDANEKTKPVRWLERVVVRRDELGRPVETIEIEDLEAASHWRADDWRPVA